MKVKIINCSSQRAWYKDKIGEIFEVTNDNKHGKEFYTHIPKGGWDLVIRKADTIPVHEIKYELSSYTNCATSCKMDDKIKVGSSYCYHCEHNCDTDESTQTVQCSW